MCVVLLAPIANTLKNGYFIAFIYYVINEDLILGSLKKNCVAKKAIIIVGKSNEVNN